MSQVAGFQDYVRLPVQTGIEIAVFSFSNKGNPGATSALDMGGYGFINVSIQDFSNPGFWKITLDWYADKAATILVAEQLFIPMPSAQESFQFPVLARWLIFRTAPVSGGPSGATNYNLLGTNVPSSSLYADKYTGPLVSNFSNIASGFVSTITATQTHGGEAYLTIGLQGSVNWEAYMEFFDYVSTLWQKFWLCEGQQLKTVFNGRVLLPYAPVRVTIQNIDPAAQNCIQCLTIL